MISSFSHFIEVIGAVDSNSTAPIELLSSANKKKGKDRDTYEAKRAAIFSSASHFIEIDLLGSQSPFTIIGTSNVGDYYVLVSRASRRPQADLYSFTLRDRLPEFLLPLKEPDEAIAVDLQSIFQEVCEQVSYDLRLDYT
ncbi:MAG: hypothetical protein DCF15_15140 [Phormidesmis priestleyi]|uniref:Uncharacterized protein n=1 Tax=Phormidesmis priestleyi TaxID=268141 RepID=A0A2W4X1R1_9CYAN|nr:MAG: hypothetical protein DCF15_15140 [Phormidesmis priestleyi]